MARNRPRRGMTLLELIIASSMLAMVMGTISVVLRTARTAWEAHEADYTRVEAAHATLRHIVREIRQADTVTEITASTNNSGRLGLLLPNGAVRVWEHDSGTQVVRCGLGTPDQMLAPGISGLRFVGLRADATTAAGSAAEVQCLRVEVTVQLPRETNGERIVSSWAWIRSW